MTAKQAGKTQIVWVDGVGPMRADQVGSAGPGGGVNRPRHKIDPAKFDALLAGSERIWGKGAIALALGLSESTVKRLADRPDVPIYRPGGRYFAYRSELVAWLHTKQDAAGGVVLNFRAIEGTGGGNSAR